ncbi:MAG: hypothetical protein RBR16_09400 [Syntrophus sp. (in: bacteria)]|nr:hypothetical protein [Syntrophus sp. (in: bacteria)]
MEGRVSYPDFQKYEGIRRASFTSGERVSFPQKAKPYPSGLIKLYRSTDGIKAALGSISWDVTPVITADGVAAGNGPDMGAVNRASRKVCVVRFKATKASTGITGDEQVFGPLYLRNGNIVGKLDGQEDTFAHTWDIGDEIAAVVEMTPSGVIVQLVGGLE